jgi:phage terminase large subunit-like protein
MMPALSESDRYYFDAEAADRPIRFAARYLRHYEGRFAGDPFEFLPWQADVVRALFGWRRRSDGLRRFRELYLLTGKGGGKTPMLAAIGFYMLLADGEQGAHVMSCATDFQQANLTLDAAKKYIGADRELARLCDPKQFEIRYPKKNGKWSVMSGTAEGRHGFRPSCLLMDEAHEWPNGKLYDNLTANTTKRAQPLTLVATNAGASQSCFAWKLHERATSAMKGGPAGETLLPVIYEAPAALDWTSEAAAAAANPSLGHILTFEQLSPELAKAHESPEGEGRYRRLFLSQWQGVTAERWLDLAEWDACVSTDEPPADAALYVGMDLAQSDDLCAVPLVWATPEKLYVDAHFWIPRATAERYESRDGIPYGKWAAAEFITLLEEPTVSSAARKLIADYILRMHWRHKVQAVCFDTYRADETVAILEAAGLKCVPITQGFRTSPGCFELERRVKEQSAVIAPNDVLRWNAENAQVERNSYGEIRVTKPDVRHQQARKVDGVSALVSALVEARRHSFPAARTQSKSKAWII